MSDLKNGVDVTNEFDSTDIENNKVMALLSYIGFLVLVPIFAARESKYAMFHANQGLVLFIALFASGIVYTILNFIPVVRIVALILIGIIYLIGLALMIMGIMNVVNGKAKKLPVIGNIVLLK